MRIVTDSDFVLLFDVGEEWTLVVHTEGENAVLIGNGKARSVDGAVFRATNWLEIETVERREHSKFELERIPGRNLKWDVFAIGIFGDFNVEDLINRVNTDTEMGDGRERTVSFLMR